MIGDKVVFHYQQMWKEKSLTITVLNIMPALFVGAIMAGNNFGKGCVCESVESSEGGRKDAGRRHGGGRRLFRIKWKIRIEFSEELTGGKIN